jgi:pyruvate dehydrogenase E2 component (dihydrolipoamide acetyltransferase)
MPIEILMPALSPTMETGNLAKWHVKEGDHVASGDVIAEIETDKATMEVEAVDEGTVAKIVVPEGTADVKVNALIALLAGEGEDVQAASKGESGKHTGAASSEAPPSGARAPSGSAPQDEAAGSAGARQKASPAPTKSPHPEAPPQAASKGQGVRQDMAEGQHQAKPNGGRIFASPLAKRLAAENKLDLSQLAGSGPHGRIVQRDIEAALKAGAGKPAPASAGAPAGSPQGMSDAQVRALFADGGYEAVPHDSMRKIIARRLVEAKTTIPHFYLTADCRIDKLLALRADINAAAPTQKTEAGEVPLYKLSVNDLVIKALAMALIAVPEANVTWTSEAMLKHKQADIGVAVSIPGGLITPVIRNADKKRLSEISNEMKALAKRARERKLKPEEYQGGSSAVSNLGMFGVKDFAAVINPPHATILAVGAGEERAIVESGEVVVAAMMTVTLSTDHRAVDGALGAELLAAFKRYIEAPAAMLA